MALDRQSIEKRDFPIGRRGYEPGSVDQHLGTLADEVEALQRSATRSTPSESLATAAAGRVQLIVEAAERSAQEIVAEAEAEAAQIRQEAREAAEASRAQATREAAEHVDRVSSTTNQMLERTDSLEREFLSMTETVRAGAHRLAEEIEGLHSTVGELRTTAGAPDNGGGQLTGEPEGATTSLHAAEPPAWEGEPAPEFEPEAPAERGDEEGARLIALNMALNGTPREETERYLSDHFGLAETDALLDDVYARAGQ